MKTLANLILAFIVAMFISGGFIAFTVFIGVGSEQLGFSQYTFWYYILCLSLCSVLLVASPQARKQLRLMSLFVVSVIMVLNIGVLATMTDSSGSNQLELIQASMMDMAKFAAQAIMYVAPGALSVFYAYLAYEGVAKPHPHKLPN